MLKRKKSTPFEELYAYLGKTVKMAEALGVTSSAVSQWRSIGGLPAGRAIQVELLTKGKFRAVDVVDMSEIGPH